MNLQPRIARIEDRIGREDEPCPDHQTTCIVSDGEPLPDDVPLCSRCGMPGAILEIVHVIVDGDADGVQADKAGA